MFPSSLLLHFLVSSECELGYVLSEEFEDDSLILINECLSG